MVRSKPLRAGVRAPGSHPDVCERGRHHVLHQPEGTRPGSSRRKPFDLAADESRLRLLARFDRPLAQADGVGPRISRGNRGRRLACQCGYREAREKIFAADGGGWCWDIQARYFSDDAGVLDWYHASEHVWDPARQVAPGSSSEWAGSALDRLHAGGGTELLGWLKSQVPPRRSKCRTALEKLI